MFEAEYRIHRISRGYVLAEPLDGAGVTKVWVSSPRRFIENEILVLGNIRARKGGLTADVVASRRDPSFLKLRPFALTRAADETEEEEFELDEYPANEECEAFERALEVYREGYYEAAGDGLRSFLRQFPLHIDSYHHLGNIEWKEGRLQRAQKYYEMGHRIGLLCLPQPLNGQLPWTRLGNRPFLRATHAYALLLSRKRRVFEACKLCEQILNWDPSDHLGIRDLLPRYYFEAKAPGLARTFLETRGADGMNHYTLGLLLLMEGRRKEALRSLCAAVTYNPYVPLFLLGERDVPEVDGDSDYVTMGGEIEAAEYYEEFVKYWRKAQYGEFVRRIMQPGSPFRRRYDRYLQIKEKLEETRDFPVRERLLAEKQKILNDDDVRALLREAGDTIFS